MNRSELCKPALTNLICGCFDNPSLLHGVQIYTVYSITTIQMCTMVLQSTLIIVTPVQYLALVLNPPLI